MRRLRTKARFQPGCRQVPQQGKEKHGQGLIAQRPREKETEERQGQTGQEIVSAANWQFWPGRSARRAGLPMKRFACPKHFMRMGRISLAACQRLALAAMISIA